MATDADLKSIVAQYEKSSPAVKVAYGAHALVYATPNSTCLARVETLTSKEPHTLAWLESMPEGGALLDVGANVGMYTIFAAVVRGAAVYAFEPESQNFSILCRNIALNGLGDRVTAWSAALSDEQTFSKIFLSAFDAGGSCHAFGAPLNAFLETGTFPFAQGAYSTTIDAVVAAGAIPVPAYIKIDVDGIEHKVVAGALATLRNPSLKSVLIEINTHLAEHRAIMETLAAMGLIHDPAQFAAAQRTEGAFKGVGECIFRRP